MWSVCGFIMYVCCIYVASVWCVCTTCSVCDVQYMCSICVLCVVSVCTYSGECVQYEDCGIVCVICVYVLYTYECVVDLCGTCNQCVICGKHM